MKVGKLFKRLNSQSSQESPEPSGPEELAPLLLFRDGTLLCLKTTKRPHPRRMPQNMLTLLRICSYLFDSRLITRIKSWHHGNRDTVLTLDGKGWFTITAIGPDEMHWWDLGEHTWEWTWGPSIRLVRTVDTGTLPHDPGFNVPERTPRASPNVQLDWLI